MPVRRADIETLPLAQRMVKKLVWTSGFLIRTPVISVLVQWRGFPVISL